MSPLLLLAGCAAPYPDYFDGAATPTLDAVSPASVAGLAGGAEITLSGQGLGGVTAVVFDGRNAEVVSASESAVVVVLPDAVAGGGPVDVGVATDGGVAWLDDAFTYQGPTSAYVSTEIASAAFGRLDCPIEAWGYNAGEGIPVLWCGMEMGYADASGLISAGPQRGFATELLGFGRLSGLPAPGEARLYGPGERRPATLPVVYRGGAPDEGIYVQTPRDWGRDLDFLFAHQRRVAENYSWGIQENSEVLAWFYDDWECYADEISVCQDAEDCAGISGDTLPIDWIDGAPGLHLSYIAYEDDDYNYEVVPVTAYVADTNDAGVVGAPSGVELTWDDWSGTFLPYAVGGVLAPGDLPMGATFDLGYRRFGEETWGTMDGLEELSLLAPSDLLRGDTTLSLGEDLVVAWVPGAPADAPSVVVVELVVYDASVDDPNWLTEVARVVAHGVDAEGGVTIPRALLDGLPAAPNRLDDNYDLAGAWGELTVTRHQLGRLSLAEGELVVDLSHGVQAPVRLTRGP